PNINMKTGPVASQSSQSVTCSNTNSPGVQTTAAFSLLPQSAVTMIADVFYQNFDNSQQHFAYILNPQFPAVTGTPGAVNGYPQFSASLTAATGTTKVYSPHVRLHPSSTATFTVGCATKPAGVLTPYSVTINYVGYVEPI